MNKVRVWIIEDSAVVREWLSHFINEDPRLEVTAWYSSAEDALSHLKYQGPDVISLDIRLPKMNGLEATLQIMSLRPTPIVVISAALQHEELNISMDALRAGALAVLEKPAEKDNLEFKLKSQKICDQLYLMSSVQVVRQIINRKLIFKLDSNGFLPAEDSTQPTRSSATWSAHSTTHSSTPHILGIVASTGGPRALSQMFLAMSGKELSVPILLVQHIAAAFVESFATWLQNFTTCPVKIAEDGEALIANTIYLAPAEQHLEVRHFKVKISNLSKVSNQRPSGNVLFSSIAKEYQNNSFGIILTGMGDDGAAGLLEIKNHGGYTLAEDQSSATVYGMPAVAMKIGAVCDSFPLAEIAPKILELVSTPSLEVQKAR